MRIEILREFVLFSRYMNFTKAAEHLNVTQPALSQHISSLEKELGVLLVDRSKPIKLTAAGEQLFNDLVPLLEHYDESMCRCREKSVSYGRIRFKKPVLNMGMVNQLFWPIINSFINDYPQINVVFLDSTKGNYLEELIRGDLDCAVSYAFDGDISIVKKLTPELASAFSASKLDFIPIAEYLLTVTVSLESPLAKKQALTLEDLSGYTLVYPYEERYYEFLYGFAAHLTRHSLDINLKPKLMDFSGAFRLDLGANEFIVSAPGFPVHSSYAQLGFIESVTQTIHVAIRNDNNNQSLSLLKNYFQKTCIQLESQSTALTDAKATD